MKLAYPIGTPDIKGAALAYQGDTNKIIGDIKAIGYSGLELIVRNPKDMDIISFTKTVENSGLHVAGVGTGPVVAEDKLTFTDKDPDKRMEALRRVKDIVDFAAIFGSQVSVGKLRGNIHSDELGKSWAWMQQAFEEICEYAEKRGIRIALEPQSKASINNFNSTKEALGWLQDMRLPNLFLMLDTYHMNLEDKSIIDSLVEAGERNIFMHFADDNRGVPGCGSIDFVEVMKNLKALNYNGYISMEIYQHPDSVTAARKAWEYLSNISRELL